MRRSSAVRRHGLTQRREVTPRKPAVGTTSVRQALPRVFIPFGADPDGAAALRADGFATVAALVQPSSGGLDDAAEATRLGCSHILRAGRAASLHTKD